MVKNEPVLGVLRVWIPWDSDNGFEGLKQKIVREIELMEFIFSKVER